MINGSSCPVPDRPCTTWCCIEHHPPARTCRPGTRRRRAPRRSPSCPRRPTLWDWRRLREDSVIKWSICILKLNCPSERWDKLKYFLSSRQQKKRGGEKSFQTFPKSFYWLKYFKQTFNQKFRSVWTFYSHWALSSRHHYNGLLLQRAVPGPPPPNTLTGQLLSLPTIISTLLSQFSPSHSSTHHLHLRHLGQLLPDTADQECQGCDQEVIQEGSPTFQSSIKGEREW